MASIVAHIKKNLEAQRLDLQVALTVRAGCLLLQCGVWAQDAATSPHCAGYSEPGDAPVMDMLEDEEVGSMCAYTCMYYLLLLARRYSAPLSL